MNKKEVRAKTYVRPMSRVLSIGNGHYLLAGSPPVTPTPSVEPPVPDEDEEIAGAKRSRMWESDWNE